MSNKAVFSLIQSWFDVTNI